MLKLAVITEVYPEFKAFLESRGYEIEEIKRKGLIAADYALQIHEYFTNSEIRCRRAWGHSKMGLWKRQLQAMVRKSKKPDLILDSLRWTPTQPLAGEEISFCFKLKNIGTASAKQLSSASFYPKLVSSEITVPVPALAVGQETEVCIPYTYKDPGRYQFRLLIDSRNSIAEINEQNNTSSSILQVDPPVVPLPGPVIPPPPQDPPAWTPKTPIPLKEPCVSTVHLTGHHDEAGPDLADYVIETFYKSCDTGCIEVTYEFPVSALKTESSDTLDQLLWEKFLPAFLQKNGLSLSECSATLLGRADKLQFNGPQDLPGNLTRIEGGFYYIKKAFGVPIRRYMKTFYRIRNNPELAYARAYYVKLKLIQVFGWEAKRIPIHVKVNQEERGSNWRGVTLRLCWPGISEEILKETEKSLYALLERTETVPKQRAIAILDTITHEKPIPDSSIADLLVEEEPKVKVVPTPPSIAPPRYYQNEDTLQVGQVLQIKNIFFLTNKAEIDTSKTQLDAILAEILDFIQRNPYAHFEIAGHTTTLCTNCLALSTQRAKLVYDELIRMGAPSVRLSYKGYGKTRPLAIPGTSIPGRRQNQRVEIKVVNLVL